MKGLLLSPKGSKGPPRGKADRTLALVMSPNFSPADAGGAPPANFSEVATGFFDSFGKGNGNGTAASALSKPPAGGCRAPAGSMGGGEPSKYCWGINWVEFEAPEVPAIFEGRVVAPASEAKKKPEGGSNNATTLSPSPLAAAAVASAAASAAARQKGDYNDYRVPLPKNAVVDLVFLNPSAMVHPMHIHGTGGWLVSSGNGRPPLLRDGGSLDAADARVNLGDPPRRNTVPVPNAAPGIGDGFAVLRFVVDNEGPFPMHCHIDYHAEGGMFLYFVYGGEEKKNGGGPPAAAPWEIPPDLDCEAATAAAEAKAAPAATKQAGGNSSSSVVVLNPFEESSWSLPQIK